MMGIAERCSKQTADK